MPRDTYPSIRVSTEYFLRNIDLATRLHGGTLVGGLVFLAIWHAWMKNPVARPLSAREVARRLHLPHETVRRHVAALVRAGQCIATPEGVAINPAFLRCRKAIDFLRATSRNAERLLLDLTRAGMANYAKPLRRENRRASLTPEQRVLATVSTGQIFVGIALLAELWPNDPLRGLVYTAIWAANVKHVTNTAPAAVRDVLPDDRRLPVSVLAIANSLRLPYETVRRHANALVKDGICIRVGRSGLVVPGAVHRRFSSSSLRSYENMKALVDELRRGGIEV